MIKILVVDDSAFMRKVLSDVFKSQPDFEVVDIGRNGAEAVEKVKQTDEARRFADERLGGELIMQSPVEITVQIQQQIQRFSDIAKQAGINQV